MQRLEVSGVVRLIYRSLGVKGLISVSVLISHIKERTWTSGFRTEYLDLRSRSRPQSPRGLRRRSVASRLLRLWARIPPGAWMCVCCECCVLSGRGLCDELFSRPEESYRLWCVVCNLEIS